MEEILRKLQKEASGSKHRAIKESCTWAIETLDSPDAAVKIPPYQLREKCLLPLQLALESKSVKLAQQALAGMQDHLETDAQHHVQVTFEDLQARRLHSLSGQPVPVLHDPHSEKVFHDV